MSTGHTRPTVWRLDRYEIGAGRCFVIAEAGVNHNGSVEMAHRLVEAAAAAGADAVKFQTWSTEQVCSPGAQPAQYQADRGATDQFELLKSLELPKEAHLELQKHAVERGLIFLSTPDDLDSARLLVQLDVPALKVGSAELANLPYLRELSRLGKPLILSTGMADELEVERATLAVGTAHPLALLHCVSSYPAPEREMNLACISTMRQKHRVPVGLSDHTLGERSAVLACALHMSIYEKHLTLDKNLPGPDHAASVTPDEMNRLIKTIRECEVMLGDGIKRMAPSERDTRRTVQRVLLYGRDLQPGEVIQAADFLALRYGKPGLPAWAADDLAGKTVRRSVKSGSVVQQVDFD